MNTEKKNDRQGIKKVADYFAPVSAKWTVIAMLLSFFTIFAMITAFGKQWYATLPEYSEFITGVTTFSGYNKQIDIKIVTNVLWALPAMFFLVQAFLRFMITKVEMQREAGTFFLSIYVLFLLFLFRGSGEWKVLAGIWLVLLMVYLILSYSKGVELDRIKEFVLNAGLFGLAIFSLYLVGVSLIQRVIDIEAFLNVSNLIFGIVLVILVLGYAFLYSKKELVLERHISFWQIFIPLGIISFLSFQYRYEATGEDITLFYSTIYKYTFSLVVLVCLGYGIYSFIKKKEGVTLPTVISVACYRSFVKPEGILNVDFFHTGEMSVPWHQLEAYGKIPFRELIPIHGLCDYYYSLINRVFFDGSYIAMNAAMAVGDLFLAMLLASVLYATVQKKEMALLFTYFFMPFMIHGAGIRYIFLFVLFFVLFSSKIRENSLRYLWWFVFLAILAIAWNVSIGGAAAAAFFVGYLLCYLKKVPKQFEVEWKEKRFKKSFFIAWSFLFVFGVSFIPVFMKIVVYLKENSATTWMANGMEMIEEGNNLGAYFTPALGVQGGVAFWEIFGFLIPFLVCILIAITVKSEYLKSCGFEFAVILFVCFLVIINYAFVRFDSGLRAGVISVFFLVVMLYSILQEKICKVEIKWHNGIYISLFLLAYMLTGASSFMDATEILAKGEVESTMDITIMGQTVEDPIVYVTGDSVGMQNLGAGFIGGNTLQNLKNIQYVLNEELKEDRAYLDMTNAVANYQLLDAKMVLPYTSGYNISNEQMQKNAIALLKEQEVDLILLAPYIRFDEATISLRSPRLYEYFLEVGYEPYVYENVIYMKKGESFLFSESNGEEAFAQLMHKEALQMLPSVWGNSEDAFAYIEQVAVQSNVSVMEQVIEHRFMKAMKGDEVDFIEITLPDNEVIQNAINQETVLSLEFLYKDSEEGAKETVNQEKNGEEMKRGFRFYLKGQKLLIPVFSSPYWKQSESLDGWRLGIKEGDGMELEMLSQCGVKYYCYKEE